MFISYIYFSGFCSCRKRKHAQIHGMSKRAIDSLHTILYSRYFPTKSNCNSFRHFREFIANRGIHTLIKLCHIIPNDCTLYLQIFITKDKYYFAKICYLAEYKYM